MWVMNTHRDGADITVNIGALQIAHILLIKARNEKGWKAHVRFMDNCEKSETVDSVSLALKLIHKHLNNPPTEK